MKFSKVLKYEGEFHTTKTLLHQVCNCSVGVGRRSQLLLVWVHPTCRYNLFKFSNSQPCLKSPLKLWIDGSSWPYGDDEGESATEEDLQAEPHIHKVSLLQLEYSDLLVAGHS